MVTLLEFSPWKIMNIEASRHEKTGTLQFDDIQNGLILNFEDADEGLTLVA